MGLCGWDQSSKGVRMIEAFWLEVLAVFLAIVAALLTIAVGWALKAFATWWATDPAQAKAKRLDQHRQFRERMRQSGVCIGVKRKRWVITEEYGPWPDRLRLQMQIWVYVARCKWLPSDRWEAKRLAESEAEERREDPEWFE